MILSHLILITFSYAKINEKIGCINEAEIAYNKILEIDKLDTETWIDYSNLLYNSNYIIKAIKVLKKGVKLNLKSNYYIDYPLIF